MKIASHQPAFLPWGGFMNKMLWADIFVLRTGLRGHSTDLVNRVKLNGAWLTLPLMEAPEATPSRDRRIADNGDPTKKLLPALRQNLGSKKNPHAYRLDVFLSLLSQVKRGDFLLDVTLPLIGAMKAAFGLTTEIVCDPNPAPDIEGTADRLFAALGKSFSHLDEYTYGAGGGAANYLTHYTPPPGVKLCLQHVHADVPDETALAALVRENDPLTYLHSIAKWEPLQ
jgi:hypothetical protein